MRRFLGFAFLAVALLLAGRIGVSSAAGQQPYDVWHVVTSGDVPFASIHTVQERQADGTRRIVQETRTLIELLGQRQESLEKFACVVTDLLEPVSCDFESQGLSGAVRARGVVKDGELALTFQRGDLQFERRISLRDKPVFSVCLSDALAARGRTADAKRLSILDSDTWTVDSAIAQRLPEAAGEVLWQITYDKGFGGGAWSLTADGLLEHAEITAPNRLIRRVTQDVASRLKHLTFADRDLLLFPVKEDLPFPARLRSIRVKLAWRDLPLDQLQLEDSRQRIVRHRVEQNRHEVELRLEQPAPINAAPPLPVTDASFAPYLADTSFICPSHSAIRDQARQWTTGCLTTLEAVRRLTHEVSGYLKGGEMIAETLSGPEVLACRKGKCAEFTTLLASLTRSVGVPTRIALGMRLVAGRWVGHMWCEAWVGQWIPVDATADEVGGSPALLKLAHSDTEFGTQRIRWALAESLELEILHVEHGKTVNAELKTGIVDQTYTNADFMCRLSAPDAHWRLVDKSLPGIVRVQLQSPGERDTAPDIEFLAFGLPSQLEPAVLLNLRKTRFASMYKGFKVIADKEENVGEAKGRRLVFCRTDPQSPNRKVKTTEVLWTVDRSCFLVNLIAEESAHDALLAEFKVVLDGFAMLQADTKAD